jgi:ATP-dependent Clp protease ATP-binding subunit ClpC
MFDRYTEQARRVTFFGRYEASQFGSPNIETEHLLLGLLREDKSLPKLFPRSHASVAAIRKQIESQTTVSATIPTSVDLPLSNECKRVLAYSAEEAERLADRRIGTEHLLLGLLREENAFAAKLLHEHGVSLEAVRSALQFPRSAAWPGEDWKIDPVIAERVLELPTLNARVIVQIGRPRETASEDFITPIA